MTRRAQWIVVGTVVLALAGALVGATLFLGDELRQLTVGSEAPDFSARQITAYTAEPRTLADYRGRVVLLNIWATWCLPCRAEMPSIQELYDAYRDRGFTVVAISTDEPGSDEAIRDFVREYDLTFDILHDPSHRIERDYQTAGIPETFVIGRDGIVRKRVFGATTWSSPANRALIARLLDERGA
ncbi:MAG: redoxin domain-containing protein [Gemmatimonadota bacterium]|nr:redoxin domain-containing protein [Gemmatimonadota bacterium]